MCAGVLIDPDHVMIHSQRMYPYKSYDYKRIFVVDHEGEKHPIVEPYCDHICTITIVLVSNFSQSSKHQ